MLRHIRSLRRLYARSHEPGWLTCPCRGCMDRRRRDFTLWKFRDLQRPIDARLMEDRELMRSIDNALAAGPAGASEDAADRFDFPWIAAPTPRRAHS